MMPVDSVSLPTMPTAPHRSEEYTTTEIVLKFFEEKAKDIAKALGYTAFWVNQMPGVPSEVKTFNTTMANFKNFIAATEVPKKGYELWGALSEMAKRMQDFHREWSEWVQTPGAILDLTNESGLWTTLIDPARKVGAAARVVFEKSTSLTNSVVDGIDFGSHFVHVEQATMTWLKTLNYASTFAGAGNDALKQADKWNETSEDNTTKLNFHMINMAKDASYMALGALGLSAAFLSVPVAPWMFVATLTSGLSWTIGGYFYERLYDPEGKGKNLNPDAIIANRLAASQA